MLTVVSGPRCDRAEAFEAAAARAGLATRRVEYGALLGGQVALSGRVRLETPGRDPELRAALLRHGAPAVAAAGGRPVAAAEVEAGVRDRGRLVAPRQAFLGLRRLLLGLARHEADFTNHPEEIVLAFDKPACKARLAAAGVPVPALLGPVRGYEALRAQMLAAGAARVFVKLDCGSAASGLLALSARGAAVRGFTTVEVGAGGALYDTRRVRRLTREAEVRAGVDGLAALGAHAERWFPKASLRGRSVDLRLVPVAGAVTHAVARVSETPFTNLHLGGARAPAEALAARIGPAAWARVLATAVEAAACFPRSLALGLDVAVGSDLRRPAVLEVNAFGDWLKGVAAPGAGPHDAQVQAILRGRPGGGVEAVLFDLDGTLVGQAEAARVAALVRAVGARYRVGLVSDGGGARQRAKLRAAGLEGLFEVVVISQELGAQKPSPRPWQAALRALGVPAARALYVGDDPVRDMVGARRAGLRTCWVARGRRYPARLAPPDHEIGDILALPGVLPC